MCIRDRIYTAPRPGTISPWSSKATDIVRKCHVDSVLRVERGICYAISSSAELDDTRLAMIGAALFDRMTECRFMDGAEASVLFEARAPVPVQAIDILSVGRPGLATANINLGLA